MPPSFDSPTPIAPAIGDRPLTCPGCDTEIPTEGLAPLDFAPCPTCTRPVLVPGMVEHYRLVDLLGQGAMGRVYLAEDPGLNRKVAVKILRGAHDSTPRMWSQLEKEAKAAAAVNHAHVVRIYRLGRIQGRPYIIMEFMEKGTLNDLVHSEKLEEDRIREISVQVMRGLRAAAESGLVHGDVKPANILLDGKGRAKVGDFGLARFMSHDGHVEPWGTPYYMAPEKIKKVEESFLSDMYSLGATLFHVTAGHPPFEAPTGDEVLKLAVSAPCPDLRASRPDLSHAFCKCVHRMMRRDPRERYPSYEAAIRDMEGKEKPTGLWGRSWFARKPAT